MSEEFIGTQDDDIMTIEGEGATHISSVTMPRDDGLPKGASTIHPCERWGHHPKFFEENGLEYEVKPRTCRHCGAYY